MLLYIYILFFISAEPTRVFDKDIQIVFIPKDLHEQFECAVGRHVSIDKPWTKISRTKIINHLQLHDTNSCFWPFKKTLEVKNNLSIPFQ